tara:strand:+ start:627 stop:869 length:243 start_codon:yes stop_codon:yes gene_type:complete
MEERRETDVPPAINVDDGNAESISGGWSPVEPSPIAQEDFCLLQHDVGVIKANVQFLLDRVLALEQHVEKAISTRTVDKK